MLGRAEIMQNKLGYYIYISPHGAAATQIINTVRTAFISVSGEVCHAETSADGTYREYYFPSHKAANDMLVSKRKEVDAYIAAKLITGEW